MKCNECGKVIPNGRYKFCSTECSIKFHSKKKALNPNCLICGEKLLVQAWKVCEKCEKERKNEVKILKLKETIKELKTKIKKYEKVIHSFSTNKTK